MAMLLRVDASTKHVLSLVRLPTLDCSHNERAFHISVS